jgi:hypothetical protein
VQDTRKEGQRVVVSEKGRSPGRPFYFTGSTIPGNRIARRLAEAMKAKIRAQTRSYGASSDAQQSTE